MKILDQKEDQENDGLMEYMRLWETLQLEANRRAGDRKLSLPSTLRGNWEREVKKKSWMLGNIRCEDGTEQ
jgi:hypothetical protein